MLSKTKHITWRWWIEPKEKKRRIMKLITWTCNAPFHMCIAEDINAKQGELAIQLDSTITFHGVDAWNFS